MKEMKPDSEIMADCYIKRTMHTPLRKYWEEGSIACAKFSDKHIPYERKSILAFIKKQAKWR